MRNQNKHIFMFIGENIASIDTSMQSYCILFENLFTNTKEQLLIFENTCSLQPSLQHYTFDNSLKKAVLMSSD